MPTEENIPKEIMEQIGYYASDKYSKQEYHACKDGAILGYQLRNKEVQELEEKLEQKERNLKLWCDKAMSVKDEYLQQLQTVKQQLQLRDKEVQELSKKLNEMTEYAMEKRLLLESQISLTVETQIELQTAQQRIKELEEGLIKISQMSDSGSPENTIIEMKSIAQQLINKQ